MIRASQIIAIFDKRLLQSDWQEMLPERMAIKVKNISKQDIKSVVITDDSIYLSPLASTTLKKRIDASYMEIV